MKTLLVLLLIENFAQSTQILNEKPESTIISTVLTEITEALNNEINKTLAISNDVKIEIITDGLSQVNALTYYLVESNIIKETTTFKENEKDFLKTIDKLMDFVPETYSFRLVGKTKQEQECYNLLFYYEVLFFYYRRNYKDTDPIYNEFFGCYENRFKVERKCVEFFEKFTIWEEIVDLFPSELLVVPDDKREEFRIANYLQMKLLQTYELLGTEPNILAIEQDFINKFIGTFIWTFLDTFRTYEYKQFVVSYKLPNTLRSLNNLHKSRKRETRIANFYRRELFQFDYLLTIVRLDSFDFPMCFSVDVLLNKYRESLERNNTFSGFNFFYKQLTELKALVKYNKNDKSKRFEKVTTPLIQWNKSHKNTFGFFEKKYLEKSPSLPKKSKQQTDKLLKQSSHSQQSAPLEQIQPIETINSMPVSSKRNGIRMQMLCLVAGLLVFLGLSSFFVILKKG